ncbi:hypothetical protein EZS27_015368 [termite gut metagenome]|uniref:Uncharacterized protein n=1 Tax=termite gut metagenome TaxID=433724 RepID=A0A5J4RRV7_9ZZZZ
MGESFSHSIDLLVICLCNAGCKEALFSYQTQRDNSVSFFIRLPCSPIQIIMANRFIFVFLQGIYEKYIFN